MTGLRTALIAVLLLVAANCTSETSGGRTATGPAGGGSSLPRSSITFREVDAALERRLADDELAGIVDVVVRGEQVLHDRAYGSYDRRTVVPIASASKWLTAAVIMTLVDDGRLSLDAPVSTYLPEWTGDKAGVTVRLLLSHRAGLAGSAPCLGDRSMTMRDCAAAIGGRALEHPVGAEFHYGNVGYTVAAAAAEVAGGADFATLFAQRVAGPTGMTSTSFAEPGRTPVPAASATSTMDDYAAFVAMMSARGVTADQRRVLRAESVDEIEKDQVGGAENPDDFAVQITGFPSYGLGVWRDRADAGGATEMVSGSGSVGFYPWIDRARGAWGILLINDSASGSGHAVRTSTRNVHDLVLPAVDNTAR